MNLTVQTLGRVVLGGIALSVSPAPMPPAPPTPTEFMDIWTDNIRTIEYDRKVREIELTKPRIVMTERFLPQSYVEVLPPEDPPLPLPAPRIKPKPIADVCTKHNMHKVWVTAKVWRCRRA